MKVNYIFLDGREQECFLSADFPLSLIETLIDYSQGVVAVEILGVVKVKN